MKDKRIIGILANVDAGKTTLSESILYLSGKIAKMGRVDNQDAYLDTEALEKERGITIFAKQATFDLGETQFVLLDTPGHVDFSMEMERTLSVLDYAVLVISGSDGVSGHTKTVWKLLSRYKIPCLIFINKMDQPTAVKNVIMSALKKQLNEGCIDFDTEDNPQIFEEIAMQDESYLETFLEKGLITDALIIKGISTRRVFPCFFGSALKLEGVVPFLDAVIKYTRMSDYPKEFGARIYKISRDPQGNRLTHLKITGGSVKVRDVLSHEQWEDKINQIRIYSGIKYETVDEVTAGDICAVTGLASAKAGDGIGFEDDLQKPYLEPVLSYQIKFPENISAREMLPKLREIEEEHPELQIVWLETLQEIHAKLMGEVQIEILQALIKSRFDISVTFDEGHIVYKETITDKVEGVGHFEPLRHYAEVHLLLSPAERGSGLKFNTICSEDILSKNWQRLVMTHLGEKQHRGVLTGANITDIEITLVSGRSHNKHTEGGDFREATFRALRQGLMEAESILLEPYYDFQLELPTDQVGRAMTDVDKMNGTCELQISNGEISTLVGSAPVLNMRNYHKEVMAYTRGFGRLVTTFKGYDICHNPEKIIEDTGYDAEMDLVNPTGSVFCTHGAGYYVPWYEVKDHMHLESYLRPLPIKPLESQYDNLDNTAASSLSLEEIDQILNQTAFANSGKKSAWKRSKSSIKSHYESYDNELKYLKQTADTKIVASKERYLLVDGYNIIFAWESLKALSSDNMDSAKDRLLDILSDYQAIKQMMIIVVFDAYRVKGHQEEMFDYHNIKVVYTKEAQTADQYIEKFAYTHGNDYQITVATSDGLQQIIVRGAGSRLLSARELAEDVYETYDKIRENTEALRSHDKPDFSATLSEAEKIKLKNL